MGCSYLLMATLVLCFCRPIRALNNDGRTLLALSEIWQLPPNISISWKSSDSTPCRWVGVGCNGDGEVISLILAEQNISGGLGPEIGRLKSLRHLDLGVNGLTGSIPPELGTCGFLEYLDLSGNLLSGEIPETLSNLNRLTYLSLSENSLSGSIPESLFASTGRRLETVYLNQNGLTGSIPSTVGNMENLLILWLNDNSLSGDVPSSIGKCTKLQELYLLNNHFTGSLPDTLSDLESLVYFDVSRNNFVGRIPLGSCKMLKQMVLSNNPFQTDIPHGLGNCTGLTDFAAVNSSLTGTIPSTIGDLKNLSNLFLNENNLSGVIPPELGNCRSLTWLQLHYNNLEGEIPKELGMLSNLRLLLLFSNRLSGEVPLGIWRIQTLETILIYNNNLSGTLPVEMTELRNLKNVTLYNNMFVGELPGGLGINSSLVEIDFTNNRFTGGIPEGICHGQKLRVLNLGRNSLHGGVPAGVGNCSSLQRLILSHNHLDGPLPHFAQHSSLLYADLSDNNISGAIPPSLGNCVNLTSINWSKNKLAGMLPLEISKLVDLQVLNVSYNNLVGPLPSEIGRCKNIYLLDLSYNFLNGSLPSSLSNLKSLYHLILEGNRFSGGIPHFLPGFHNLLELRIGENLLGGNLLPSLGALDQLTISLNLSRNGLTGEVPTGLGKLKMLQSLDLSSNNLTGSLKSLISLYSLVHIDVSNNNFSGPIPSKWIKFVYSSPSSFLGNPGLYIPCHSTGLTCKVNSTIQECNSNYASQPVESSLSFTRYQLVMVVVGSLLFVISVLVILSYIYVWGKKTEAESIPFHKGSFTLLDKVMEATENLNDKHIIGRGAHGIVYRVSISQERLFAVKKILFSEKKGINKCMVREIQTIGNIRHRNLVKLVDFWVRDDYGLLLYEYMAGGSLHDILHERRPSPVLQWQIRYNIALGTAHGLAYLHYDCNPAVIHRDIKPKNILLNSDMEPHISDFGIAKLMDEHSLSFQSSTVVGTVGYLSPETAYSVRKSKEVDVYSYGVVLLELVTRKIALEPSNSENADLVSWVNSTLNTKGDLAGVLDPDLLHETLGSSNLEEVKEVLSLALRCTSKSPSERPSMRDVVKLLTDVKLKNKTAKVRF